MAAYWDHPEEEFTVGKLLNYCNHHIGSKFTITYADGESFLCKFATSYDSDNEDRVDDGLDTELIDYFAIAVEPLKTIVTGKRNDKPGDLIELNCRDFPVLITAMDGTVIYSK